MSNIKYPGLEGKDLVFIAIVKLAEKSHDIEFLTSFRLVLLGEYLGVNSKACILIYERFRNKYKPKEKQK